MATGKTSVSLKRTMLQTYWITEQLTARPNHGRWSPNFLAEDKCQTEMNIAANCQQLSTQHPSVQERNKGACQHRSRALEQVGMVCSNIFHQVQQWAQWGLPYYMGAAMIANWQGVCELSIGALGGGGVSLPPSMPMMTTTTNDGMVTQISRFAGRLVGDARGLKSKIYEAFEKFFATDYNSFPRKKNGTANPNKGTRFQDFTDYTCEHRPVSVSIYCQRHVAFLQYRLIGPTSWRYLWWTPVQFRKNISTQWTDGTVHLLRKFTKFWNVVFVRWIPVGIRNLQNGSGFVTSWSFISPLHVKHANTSPTVHCCLQFQRRFAEMLAVSCWDLSEVRMGAVGSSSACQLSHQRDRDIIRGENIFADIDQNLHPNRRRSSLADHGLWKDKVNLQSVRFYPANSRWAISSTVFK